MSIKKGERLALFIMLALVGVLLIHTLMSSGNDRSPAALTNTYYIGL